MKLNNLTIYLLLLIITSTSCTLNPHYKKPAINSNILIPENNSQSIAAYELGWNDYFVDNKLKALIKIALKNNKDLKLTILNVEEVASQLRITQSNLIPKVDASWNIEKNKISTTGVSKKYTLGVGVASFEFDLFGKVRSLRQASLHQFLASKYAQQVYHISLVASVAKAYYTYETAKDAMALSSFVMKNRKEGYNLSQKQFKQGLISDIELLQNKTQVEQAKITYEEQKRKFLQCLNILTLLIGESIPSDLPSGLSLDKQFNHNILPSGIPSEVLNNRPDILQAEEQLKAANYNVGVARAAFFPSIKLTGNYGSISPQLHDLFKSGHNIWSFTPQINIPIFHAGELKANLNLSKIKKKKALLQYEKSIQEAFKEISDALNDYTTLSSQYKAQIRLKNTENQRLHLIELRYKNGLNSAINLLDSKRESFHADLKTIETRLLVLNNRVDIYKVLGGGLLEVTENNQ